MWTFKNIVAVGLFLFGTTFVWMTASFAGRTPPPQGSAWTIENVLALTLVVGFGAAAWGVYRDLGWWEPVAVVSGIVGLIAVVPYAFAIADMGGFTDSGVQINLAMHVIGSAAVLAMVTLPAAHTWLMHRL
jgi:hypothetical protein